MIERSGELQIGDCIAQLDVRGLPSALTTCESRSVPAGDAPRWMKFTDPEFLAGCLLGLARQLSNSGFDDDSQNDDRENVRGHITGALAEVAAIKLLASDAPFEWRTPFKHDGGRATGGPDARDLLVGTGNTMTALEVKSAWWGGSPYFSLNMRKLLMSVANGRRTWTYVAISADGHQYCSRALEVDLPAALLESVGESAGGLSLGAQWRAGKFHPESFRQSYLRFPLNRFGVPCPSEADKATGRQAVGRWSSALQRFASQYSSAFVSLPDAVDDLETLLVWGEELWRQLTGAAQAGQ